MGRPGKSRFQRAARARARLRSEQAFSCAPHSFVFPRGRPGRSLRALCRDLRRVLEPYTARNLQVRRSNSLRDLVAVAGPLGVSHFLTLSKSQSGVNLKLFRLPGGPTLTFKVLQYSLVRDVVSSLRRHRMHEQQFLQPPLLVLGGFGARPQLGLVAGMFQGMFPALNVHTVKLNSIRRCLLISCDADSQLLEFRHYAVQVLPLGLSRGLRRILRHQFPDLGRARDVSQLLTGEVAMSESEAEPDASQKVPELAQNCAGRGNAVTQQSAIRLTEVGPRLTLQLLKVEEGLGQGDVLYHALAPKGEAELQVLRARREQRLQVRLERRRRQEQNLERKRQQRERHRERSLAGMGRAPGGDTRGDTRGDARGGPGGPAGDSDAEDPGAPEAGEAEASDEDEAEYYRQELGEEPDADLFPGCSKRKRSPSAAPRARKRRKRSPKSQKSTPGSQKSHPGTPKSQKSTPGTQKSTPGTPKSTPGTPKSQKFTPGFRKSTPGTPKSQKSRPGTPNSTPGTPKSRPGNPKFRPGTPKSQRGTPKSHPGSQKSTPGTPKSHPGHPRNPKSHSRKPGTPKSQRESPKSQPGPSRSHPGHPKNPKSHPKNPKSNPKNPKSRRGKLLSPQKIPNFPHPGKARKRKK